MAVAKNVKQGRMDVASRERAVYLCAVYFLPHPGDYDNNQQTRRFDQRQRNTQRQIVVHFATSE